MNTDRIVYCLAAQKTVQAFLLPQLRQIKSDQSEFHIVCSDASVLNEKSHGVAQMHDVPIAREISLKNDFIALTKLISLFRKLKPKTVVASTPKGGLLGTIASWLTGVPRRIYHVRGLRYETTTGLKRRILMSCEWLTCLMATEVVCNAENLRHELSKNRLCPFKKTLILGAGSACGVDTKRFQPSPQLSEAAKLVRQKHNIPEQAKVIGFIGRLTRDKGVSDLLTAFLNIAATDEQVHLLLVGGFENGDPVDSTTANTLHNHPRIHLAGVVRETENYYAAFELLAFPSKREGFPNVVLESAAMQLPTVGYRVTGVEDAIEDGVTGTLANPGDVSQFQDAIANYLENQTLRLSHGAAARSRVVQLFRVEIVTQLWSDYVMGHKATPVEQKKAA